MIQSISNHLSMQNDSFDTNIQNNKNLNEKDTFSSILSETEKVTRHNKNDKTEVDNDNTTEETSDSNKINDDNLGSDHKKQTKKSEKNNKEKNIDANKNTEDKEMLASDSNDKNIKNVDIYNNIIDLVKLDGSKLEKNIDIKSLIKKINKIIEHLELLEKDKNTDTEINNILSLLQEIKISINTRVNNKLEIKDSIALIQKKIDNLLDNVKGSDTKLSENIRALSNELNKLVDESSNNINVQTASFDNSNTGSNDIAKTSSEKIKPRGDKIETNFSKSTESISNEKMTEFTVVKSKDNLEGIIDSPIDNNKNTGKGANVNTNSSIDIMNKFQDMLSRVVERARLTLSEGKTDMIIALKPEHLGNVRMKMTMEGDNFYAKIFVDNAEVKDIFTKNLDTIISSLKELNINIEGFDVTLNQNGNNEQGSDEDDNLSMNTQGREDASLADAHIDQTLLIATHLFPERKLDIVI